MSDKNLSQELLQELVSTIKDAKKFTLDQAPDIAKELLLQQKISFIFSISAHVIILIGLLTLALLTTEPHLMAIGYVCGGAVGFFLLLMTHEFITFLVAPKVFLLEKLNDLIHR